MTTKRLLDRETIDQFIQSSLSPIIALLRETVDYGVDLLDKCGQRGGSLSDLIIIGHFFKHAVTMFDATEILLSRGAVFAAGVSARSMLEAYICLEWLLKTDTESRARHFYVWHLRQKREWARRLIPGTDENQRFQKQLSTLTKMQDPAKRATLEAEARRQDADLTNILTNVTNEPINDQFEHLKKRHLDVHWYVPTGAKSIRDITAKLSLETDYEFFSQFSDITHAGAFEKHVKFDGKGVFFFPVRSPEGIDALVNVTVNLAFRLYSLIIKTYFPSDLGSFNETYVTQWRSRFLSIPKVVLKHKGKI